jgi:Astacin (Peptidase family M12A).
MKNLIRTRSITFLALVGILCSCSNEDLQPMDDLMTTSNVEYKEALDFVAALSPQQSENLKNTGEIFLPEQQKNSWDDSIAGDVPARWGVFDNPFKSQTRAVGIWGSYPAQHWTMIRLKTANLDSRIRDAINEAVDQIESNTNVRFYNSQYDAKYYEPGHFEFPNVYIRYSNGNNEGSGSFGLVGGEQYVHVPADFANRNLYTDEEIVAFLMHAFCNAAGMFNEQQRKDRDSFVDISLNNVKSGCTFQFTKQSNNYAMLGNFDYHSITLASSKAYSKNGGNTITKKGGGLIARNYELSTLDKSFLNEFYLPYIARTDLWMELDKTVFYNGRKLTESERLQLQSQLNQQRGLYGNPPANGRIEREPW